MSVLVSEVYYCRLPKCLTVRQNAFLYVHIIYVCVFLNIYFAPYDASHEL